MAIEHATAQREFVPRGLVQWLKDGKPKGATYRYLPDGRAVREWTLPEMQARHEQIARRLGLPAKQGITLAEMRQRMRVRAARYGLPL